MRIPQAWPPGHALPLMWRFGGPASVQTRGHCAVRESSLASVSIYRGLSIMAGLMCTAVRHRSTGQASRMVPCCVSTGAGRGTACSCRLLPRCCRAARAGTALGRTRCQSSTARTWTCLAGSWPASSWPTTPSWRSAPAHSTLQARWAARCHEIKLPCMLVAEPSQPDTGHLPK